MADIRDGGYRYCPFCATPLQKKEVFHRVRGSCPACGFVHFLDPKVAVIAFVTHGDRLLLIRRAVDPARGRWALPGGFMDAGEMPHEALKREIREEVGLEIRVGALMNIFPMNGPGSRSWGIVLAYRGVPVDDTVDDLRSGDDVSEAGWFGPESLPADLAFDSTRSLLRQWQADGSHD